MNRRFTYFVLGAMLLGVLVGFVLHRTLPNPAAVATVSGYLSIVTDVFLRLIKMIIAPLVFATLVGGIARMEDPAAIGRVGIRTLVWFLGASIVSLAIGLLFAHLLQPGAGLGLQVIRDSAPAVDGSALTLKDFMTHLVPTSSCGRHGKERDLADRCIFCALRHGDGRTGRARIGASPGSIEQIGVVMLKVTGYVIACAPIAVFASLAATVTTQGIGYSQRLCEVYRRILSVSRGPVGDLIGRHRFGYRPGTIDLMRAIREPTLLAFSTASSEAAYPLAPRAPECIWDSAADRFVRVAAWLFVQSCRLNDVLHVRGVVHCPGISNRADSSPSR